MWAYDFVFDACANGQTVKCLTVICLTVICLTVICLTVICLTVICLTVIDEWTRECLAIDFGSNIRSGRVSVHAEWIRRELQREVSQ